MITTHNDFRSQKAIKKDQFFVHLPGVLIFYSPLQLQTSERFYGAEVNVLLVAWAACYKILLVRVEDLFFCYKSTSLLYCMHQTFISPAPMGPGDSRALQGWRARFHNCRAFWDLHIHFTFTYHDLNRTSGAKLSWHRLHAVALFGEKSMSRIYSSDP